MTHLTVNIPVRFRGLTIIYLNLLLRTVPRERKYMSMQSLYSRRPILLVFVYGHECSMGYKVPRIG